MIRSLAAILTLAAGWSLTDFSWDRLRWNARERTDAGIESLGADNESAIEAFETVTRLDPEDPVARFNAGSAHLAAETPGALAHLEIAAESSDDDLQAPANYNLGNARLAADDAAGAIEAFEQALRHAPDYQDAKFNLELALRQHQQDQENQENQGDKSSDPNDRDNPGSQGDESQEEGPDEQPPDEPNKEGDQEQEQDSSEGEQNDQQEGDRNPQLPQFEEQPDMSAEQAAAVLEAVENLEREERRRQAEEEMKKRPRKGKDW